MEHETPAFPPEEFRERRRRVRAIMSEKGVDGLLISTPENIYYLTGLDHMGYSACHILVLPVKGTPILITRAMEKPTVADQAPDITHYGYPDGSTPIPPAEDRAEQGQLAVAEMPEDIHGHALVEPMMRKETWGARPPLAPVEETVRAVSDLGLTKSCLGLEEGGSFLTYRIAHGIKTALEDVDWIDGTGMVDQCRFVMSPLEIRCTKRAALVTDSMMLAAIAAAGEGVGLHEVMAAIYDSMFRRGGTYPGYVPLVRSTASLTHEHGTWQNVRLVRDDMLFLEMSGCIRRYHAPMGRLVFITRAPRAAYKALETCLEAQSAAVDAMAPGVMAGDVYEAWHSVLDRNGLSSYTRHHCGYSTGIGYPPSWSGGGVPVGLRPGSELRLEAGMVFHAMSWLLRSDLGDSFLSDTAIVTDDGCELITHVPRDVVVRY